MQEKCGHSMDNGFILKKKILGAVFDLPANQHSQYPAQFHSNRAGLAVWLAGR